MSQERNTKQSIYSDPINVQNWAAQLPQGRFQGYPADLGDPRPIQIAQQPVHNPSPATATPKYQYQEPPSTNDSHTLPYFHTDSSGPPVGVDTELQRFLEEPGFQPHQGYTAPNHPYNADEFGAPTQSINTEQQQAATGPVNLQSDSEQTSSKPKRVRPDWELLLARPYVTEAELRAVRPDYGLYPRNPTFTKPPTGWVPGMPPFRKKVFMSDDEIVRLNQIRIARGEVPYGRRHPTWNDPGRAEANATFLARRRRFG